MKLLLSILLFIPSFLHAQNVSSVKSGRWSDAKTWGGKTPAADHIAVIGNMVTIDVTDTVKGLVITKAGTLKYEPRKSVTLYSYGNVVNNGLRIMAPASSAINHALIFLNVDENRFVGGGMDIEDTDTGDWTRGGANQIRGTYKTPWTRLFGGVKAGSTIIQLARPPTNWRAGDELAIAPTLDRSVKNFYKAFDTVRIKSIRGNVVTLAVPLVFDHPSVKNPFNDSIYTAEVVNLTRNVRIEGTPEGKAHMNIMSDKRQVISFLQLRHMGPKIEGEQVTGRYPLHFHHCGSGSAGSIISGTIIRDCPTHNVVIHASDFVTVRTTVTLNSEDDAFWWDPPPGNSTDPSNNSNYTIYDSCGVMGLTGGYRCAGFVMGAGIGNSVTNSWVAGNGGNAGSAGFVWPEWANRMDNVWDFKNNLSHNGRYNGLFSWQNDEKFHSIESFIGYNHFISVEHGAYHNSYRYSDIDLINHEKGFVLHALGIRTGVKDSMGYLTSFTRIRSTEPLYIVQHTLQPGSPSLFYQCLFPKVIIQELPRRMHLPIVATYDFVECNLKPEQFEIKSMELGSLIRVQDGERAYQIEDKGIITNIEKFYK